MKNLGIKDGVEAKRNPVRGVGSKKGLSPFPAAALPNNESQRLATLRQYQILDTLPEQAYDDIVELASQICETPIAHLGLMDQDRQWIKAKVGMDIQEVAREQSICKHTMEHPTNLFVIPNALLDERFADHPLVTGKPFIRFYAGALLETPTGEVLGTLCVIDHKPRSLKPKQALALRALARQVMSQLELRRTHYLLAEQTQTILQSEHQHRSLVEAMSEGVLQFEADGSVSMCNAAAERLLGQSRENILKRQPSRDWRAIRENGQAIQIGDPDNPTDITFRTGQPQSNVAVGIYQPSGELVWVLINTRPLKHSNDSRPYAVITTLTDITARKQEELIRRQAEHKLETLFDHSIDFMMLLNSEGGVLEINSSALDYLGASKAQVLGCPLPELARWLNLPQWEQQLHDALVEARGGRFARIELIHAPAEGTQRLIDVTFKPVVGQDGRLEYMICEGRDNTERKQAEAHKALLAFSIDQAMEGVALLDPSGVYTYMNPIHASMYGYSSEDLIGKTWHQLYSPEQVQIIEEEYFPVLLKEGKWRGPLTGRKKTGEPFAVETSLTLLQDLGGAGNSLLCTCRDITQQHQAEQKIRDALHEKEVLLKEVYHRVKNNLQVTSSLINLQREALPHPEVRRALQESANRIKSMALIHEKLYLSRDLAGIDFREYLDSLVDHLRQVYQTQSSSIGIQTECDNLQLPLDSAIPCGLILNELVSNAMEHAFPEGSGLIRIRVEQSSDGQLRLKVADNGVGLPHGLGLEDSTSLGLQLVSMLSQQLGGQCNLTSDTSGTVFELVFVGHQAQGKG